MRAKLMAEAVDENDSEQKFKTAIFILEKELGCNAATNEDSLLLKFYSQLDELADYVKKEKEEYDKIKRGNGRTLG